MFEACKTVDAWLLLIVIEIYGKQKGDRNLLPVGS